MSKDLPEDVVTRFGFDNTKFIRASIDEVKETVYVAFLLVIVIIFLFLRDWRVTLIPCVVIPVSLRRGVFRHVRSRLLDQRAVDAGRRAGRRSRRRRRDRDDREHLYPYRAGNDARKRRESRDRRKFSSRSFRRRSRSWPSFSRSFSCRVRPAACSASSVWS